MSNSLVLTNIDFTGIEHLGVSGTRLARGIYDVAIVEVESSTKQSKVPGEYDPQFTVAIVGGPFADVRRRITIPHPASTDSGRSQMGRKHLKSLLLSMGVLPQNLAGVLPSLNLADLKGQKVKLFVDYEEGEKGERETHQFLAPTDLAKAEDVVKRANEAAAHAPQTGTTSNGAAGRASVAPTTGGIPGIGMTPPPAAPAPAAGGNPLGAMFGARA